MKKHTTKKVRVSKQTRTARGETPAQRGMRLLQEREAAEATRAHAQQRERDLAAMNGPGVVSWSSGDGDTYAHLVRQSEERRQLVREFGAKLESITKDIDARQKCDGDPRQCSTAYCPECVPGAKEAAAAVGVRGAAPHTAEVPLADRWAPGNTVEGMGYASAPAGVFVATYGGWLCRKKDGTWSDLKVVEYVPGELFAPRTIIARPADAPAEIPHYPPRPVQLQPDDLKLGGMVDVQVTPPEEPAWTQEEHDDAVYDRYTRNPARVVGVVVDAAEHAAVHIDERLFLVLAEQLIAEAWGLTEAEWTQGDMLLAMDAMANASGAPALVDVVEQMTLEEWQGWDLFDKECARQQLIAEAWGLA